MSEIDNLFASLLYRAQLGGPARLNGELGAACRAVAEDDSAGRRWSRRHAYPGYTSYASLNDLPWRFPPFAALETHLDRHAAAFARAAAFDLMGGALALDSLWVNVLDPGGHHSGHIHPHSVISGTYYVATPPGASALKFEDPRHAMMMAAPPRKARAPRRLQPFVYVTPEAGEVLMWESWLRHEVQSNAAEAERISISFNYRWDRA
jgi:uncharacterized protein (TIGR02466 family)